MHFHIYAFSSIFQLAGGDTGATDRDDEEDEDEDEDDDFGDDGNQSAESKTVTATRKTRASQRAAGGTASRIAKFVQPSFPMFETRDTIRSGAGDDYGVSNDDLKFVDVTGITYSRYSSLLLRMTVFIKKSIISFLHDSITVCKCSNFIVYCYLFMEHLALYLVIDFWLLTIDY
jgi:hypothetical protein